jgi:hypothetical protein
VLAFVGFLSLGVLKAASNRSLAEIAQTITILILYAVLIGLLFLRRRLAGRVFSMGRIRLILRRYRSSHTK